MSQNIKSDSVQFDDSGNSDGSRIQYIANNLTFVGPKYICGSEVHVIRRCAWFLLSTLFTCVLLYLLGSSLRDYYRYETTKITTYIEMDNVTLPAVTICSDEISFQIKKLPKDLRSQLNNDKTKITDSLNFGYDYEPSTMELKDFLQNITWLDLIFIKTASNIESCYYMGEPCPTNVTPVYNYANNRPCFTFHSQQYIDTYGPIVFNKTGYKYSVKIELKKERLSLAHSIIIHNPNVMPDSSISLQFSPGVGYIVGIQKQENHLLGDPYSNCSKTDLHHPASLHWFYNKEKCKNHKREEIIYSNCNCTLKNVYGQDYQCSAYVYLKCASKLFYTMEATTEHACLPACQQITYKITPSSKIYDTTSRTFRKALVQLYFENLDLSVHKEVPLVTVQSLFGSFGGLIGLFVGISSLSLIELIDLTCVVLCQRIFNRK